MRSRPWSRSINRPGAFPLFSPRKDLTYISTTPPRRAPTLLDRRGRGDNVASMAWNRHAVEQTQLRKHVASRAWGRGRSRRARTNGTQSTREKPPAAIAPATARRRRCGAGRRTTPCSAGTSRPTRASSRTCRTPIGSRRGLPQRSRACRICRLSPVWKSHCVGCAVDENAAMLAPSSGGTGASTPLSRCRVDGVGAMIQPLRRRAARI